MINFLLQVAALLAQCKLTWICCLDRLLQRFDQLIQFEHVALAAFFKYFFPVFIYLLLLTIKSSNISAILQNILYNWMVPSSLLSLYFIKRVYQLFHSPDTLWPYILANKIQNSFYADSSTLLLSTRYLVFPPSTNLIFFKFFFCSFKIILGHYSGKIRW